MIADALALMEKMTGELYARFAHERAEHWHEWVQTQPGATLAHYEWYAAMDWVQYFEPIVPTLISVIKGLTFARYESKQSHGLVLEAKFREKWMADSPNGVLVTHCRDYEARAEISLHLLVGRIPDVDIMPEVERILVAGLVDAFEKYQREGMHPIAPAQPAFDPLQMVRL